MQMIFIDAFFSSFQNGQKKNEINKQIKQKSCETLWYGDEQPLSIGAVVKDALPLNNGLQGDFPTDRHRINPNNNRKLCLRQQREHIKHPHSS